MTFSFCRQVDLIRGPGFPVTVSVLKIGLDRLSHNCLVSRQIFARSHSYPRLIQRDHGTGSGKVFIYWACGSDTALALYITRRWVAILKLSSFRYLRLHLIPDSGANLRLWSRLTLYKGSQAPAASVVRA